MTVRGGATLLFLVTEDWYFVSHRLPLARAALAEGYRVIVATRVQEHGPAIREAGCELVPLDWKRGPGSLLGEFRSMRRLLALYLRERPAVVHHVALKPVVYGSLVARLSGVPIVVNAIAGLGYVFTNQTTSARLLRSVLRPLLRYVLNRPGSWAILQNPDDQVLLEREVALESRRVVLIRGVGVDLERFAFVPEPAGSPVVVLPARMLEDKGVREFVAAARQLREEGTTARFALVGGVDTGNPSAIDAATLQTWVAEGAVEWWGHRSNMAEVYAAAHVACLPSYREGLPKVLLEAAACGRPIVATDVPGCREVVRGGVNGLLVPPREAEPLAAALRTLIDAPHLRAAFGRQGRSWMERDFSVTDVARETLLLYRQGPD